MSSALLPVSDEYYADESEEEADQGGGVEAVEAKAFDEWHAANEEGEAEDSEGFSEEAGGEWWNEDEQ